MTTTSIASTRAATIALIVSITGMLTAMNALADIPTAWSQSPPSAGYDEANAIALDVQGNVYVTGQSGPIPSGQINRNGDFVTIKYNAAGVEQWRAVYDGPNQQHDVANSLVIDRLGSVYVSGATNITFNAQGGMITGDITTLKLNPSTGQIIWEMTYTGISNGPDYTYTNSLAVDRAGNVYVTGESAGVGTPLHFDIVTIKYKPNGDREWLIPYSGLSATSNDRGRALKLDPFGNVYVIGRSTGVDGFADFVTFKYNPSGELRWLARYDDVGPNSVDFPNDIALDRFGNVIVVGESYVNFNPDTDIPRVFGCKGNFTTVKYSPSGQQLWTRPYNGTGNCDDYQPVVAVDAFVGNIYVAGISQGTGTDYATIKYSPAGNEVWASAARFSGPNGAPNPNDAPNAIALDLYGDIYVTGAATESIPSGGFTDLEATTVKYNASGRLQWVQRYRNFRSAANAIAVDRARNVFIAGWTFNFVTPTPNDLDYAVVKNTINYVGPVAEFIYSPATPIEDQPVQFTDQSTQPSTWAWDFDNDGIVNSTLQNPTFTFANPGSYAVTLTVTNPLASPPPVTHTVVVESNSNVPYVDSVVRQYPGFFLQGTVVQNKFDASINWKGDPGTAAFQVGAGLPSTEMGNSAGASHVFQMDTDFPPSFNASTILITPTNAAGTVGLPRDEKLYLFPLPTWVKSIPFLRFVASESVVTVELSKSFPEEPVKNLLVFPESVPYVGGEFGIRETQATISGSVSSTGEGSLGVSGKSEFTALKGKLEITLSGTGDFTLYPPDGLTLRKAILDLGVKGTIEREVGIADAIPQLKALQAFPVIGGPISWLNEKAILKGEISPFIGLQAVFEQEKASGSLQFTGGEGTLGLELKATLEIEIVKDSVECSAWVAGKGQFTLGLPATVEKPLFRRGDISLEVGAEIEFSYLLELTAKATLEAKCSYEAGSPVQCGLASSSSSALPAFSTDSEVRTIEPDYDRFGRYSEFHPRTAGKVASASSLVPISMSESAPITNVFKGASPNLVELGGGRQLLLFVRQDPADPVLQSTDIAWSLYDGSSWSSPQVLNNDTQVELGPAAGIDANGKVVAVWTRIKDAVFTTPIPAAADLPLFYTRLEVVTATFDPSTTTWSAVTPLTNDAAFDSTISLASDAAGNLLLTWLSNAGGEFMSTSSNPSTLKYSTWNGSSWSVPAEIAGGLAGVSSYAAARRGTSAFVILSRDPSPSTLDDGVLDLYTWDGTSWSAASTFAAGGVENRLPSVVYDATGTGHVVWIRGDDLVHATLASPTPQLVRSSSSSLSFYDAQLLINSAGNLTLLRHESVANGPANLVAMLYDTVSNTWSVDRRLTEDPGKATQLSAYFGGDGKIHAAYLSTAIIRKTKTFTIDGQPVAIDNIPEDGQTDLHIFDHALITDLAVNNSDLQIEPANPHAGDSVTATLSVHNAGDFAAGAFVVSFYAGDPNAGGTLLAFTNVPGPLRAGDAIDVSANFTYPTSGADIVAVVDSDNAVTEFSETNNRATIYLVTNTRPEAVIIPSLVGGPAPLTVDFNGVGSFDPDGDAISYAWSFSDGTASATGTSVNHTFTQAGEFLVVLGVTDARGAIGITSVLITVTGGAPQPPTITGFTPTSGPAGTSVVITGTNFLTVNSIKFNGVAASGAINSATQLTATVPIGATTGPISVTNSVGTATSSTNFTVPQPPPSITGFSPASGPVGTVVTITGTNFTGTTSVTFNGLSATFSVTSATQISATVPAGATSGAISVTTPDGTATSTSFTVLQAPGALRGDANGDNAITVADIFFLINHLFAGGPTPSGITGDANSAGGVTVADVFFLINFLFANGPSPAP